MTKEQFLEQVTDQIRAECAVSDMDVGCGIFMKNNDTMKHGIVLKRRDEFISPTIYVDDFYQDFLRKKKTMKEVAEEVWERLAEVEEHARQYRDFSAEFEDCRRQIIYRLISLDRNKQFLQSVPYLPFLNLAIVFCIVCDASEDGLETILITDEVIERWQTSTKELVRLAEENTPRILPATVDSLTTVLLRYIGLPEEETSGKKSRLPMFLLSNQSGVNGASVLLYPDILAGLADQCDSDLFILPSSIHELIVIPAGRKDRQGKLSEMVADINKNHVNREEVLSDTAYFYDRKKRKITL